ncbi:MULTISPECIES: class Ib ribonucleoside-diphosphate reductase assembly flavoprotein NrdI [Bacillus subtilis group]|uniref:class Ib ribonucleoside-diphosphate reductase assembly flavoprotein NrdI n=1 Tax=Bacillus subtilis group TaxID=653685 RepID=UPI0011A23BA6|nr:MULTISPECIES: class Ib ribonucleoside-diphosphate reductase assembly flavoprotein NrdI [Bacillus subtilis group]MEC2335155.1 class Ib ribonucleoside-diphosphate reductase assembly flavoprotein NrdI [Bacillus subtilis]
MIVAYASLTGKVRNFAERLQKKLPNCEFIHVQKDMVINEPFVLITYTWGKGDIPKEVRLLLQNSGDKMVAVVGSGERNWGEHRFCKASIDISGHHNIPLLHNFEKMGYDSDVEIVASKIKQLQKG